MAGLLGLLVKTIINVDVSLQVILPGDRAAGPAGKDYTKYRRFSSGPTAW